MGGGVGQGWVMARQALTKDASSERNFIAMEGMGQTYVASAEEPGTEFCGACGQ